MNIDDFVKDLKGLKQGKETGSLDDFKVHANIDRTFFNLNWSKRCRTCGHKCEEFVIVKFKKPQGNLTIFQAGLLFSMYVLKSKPRDYAQYHKCIAGKRFIENIKEVIV